MVHSSEWSTKHRRTMLAFSLAGIGLLIVYFGVMVIDGQFVNLAEIQQAIVGRG